MAEATEIIPHTDQRVTVQYFQILREFTPRYDLLPYQFDGSRQFCNWVVMELYAEYKDRKRKRQGYNPPSLLDVGKRISVFRRDHFEHRDKVSHQILEHAAWVAAQRFRRMYHWPNALTQLPMDRFDLIRVRYTRTPRGNGETEETGVLRMTSRQIRSNLARGLIPDHIQQMSLPAIGPIGVDISRSETADGEPKHFVLIRDAEIFGIKVILGPPGHKVAMFGNDETEEGGQGNETNGTDYGTAAGDLAD